MCIKHDIDGRARHPGVQLDPTKAVLQPLDVYKSKRLQFAKTDKSESQLRCLTCEI